MSEKKKKPQRIGRPPWWAVLLLGFLLKPWYRLRYGVKIDKSAMKQMKGPALVLAPHICGRDHFLVLQTLWRHRPNYVGSAHLMAKPRLGRLLKRLRVIPKKMFCADIRAIRDIMRARAEGNVIVLFPEGRLPACGHSLPIAEGTAELVKRLGIDVFIVTSNGAYLTFPKWGRVRRGKIRVVTERLFEGQALADMSVEEIKGKLTDAMRHDDELAMRGVRYRTSDTTAGIDGLLRRCPVCGEVGHLSAGRGKITCTCGMHATLDEYWRLDGVRFTRVNEWFDWQQSEMDPETDVLTHEVIIGTTDERGRMVSDAGVGRIRLDRDTFTFEGAVFGEAVTFAVPTESIAGLPVTPSDHFDLFVGGRMYHFAPMPDARAAIDYVMFIDRLAACPKKAENN